ncbi:MAG: chorismate mutase/prephenate dehydratase, partial [Pirellulaceae bacterium]
MPQRKQAKTSKADQKPRGGKLTKSQLAKTLQSTDNEIVALVNERAQLVQQLAEMTAIIDDDSLMNLAGCPQAIEKLIQSNSGPLSESCIRAVLREVVSGSRALIRPLRIAFLGPKYSFSYLAALERFGECVDFEPVTSIAAVFEEIERGNSQFGLVPIENSTDGRITDTLHMFASKPQRICGEVQLRIHHNLLADCRRDEVTEVHSKPQALSQCRSWLSKHLPQARWVETASTTAAAETAAKSKGAAAIASKPAGDHYGLKLLAGSIEDNPDNITRFAVIGEHQAGSSGNDKTSLMFELAHQPGALADAMNLFKRNQLNLTWIESFPMRGATNEYVFFVELEGHQTDPEVAKAV